ncbi:GLUG motif-containing protein [Gudongella sp. SC589]|uniref:GLUG motif-containing protein n=1 Tax=Gudongella sp. SC589 TaxID=3385990 RepID=UPI003904B3A2
MYKKILSWLLTFAMVFSMLGGVGQVAFGQSFNDISAHWAKDDIEEWSGKGLISGYEDGTFRPDDKITRAEFVKLINNVISIKMEESISFVDVEERDWYFRDLRKAIYGEYIAGYEDNTFRANELITRQEAAVILKNLVQLEEIEGDVLGKFVDTNNTPDWSKAALILAVQKGYLTGYTDGTLKASNYITRAESVKVLDNLFGIIYNEPGVYGPSLDQGKLELKGNLTVSVNDVTLQNMIIDGDLYLAEGIGDGDVILDNITVKGETIVKGGGANSIIIRNSSLQNLLIIKKDGNIRIIAQGSTSINNTYLHSSAKLKGEELNNSFGAVEIIRVTPGVAIELEGGFEKIDLLANADIEINGKSELQELYIHKDLENVYIQVSRDSTVKKLYANSEIEVVIRGVIIEALGEFAKASSYDIKLPENLKPKSSSGTSRPAAPKYTLALDIVPAGAGTVIGSGSYEEGTEVNVSANANDGYEFVEWREGKNLLTTSSAFSYTTTSESKTFTAYFESTGEFAGGSGTEEDPYRVANPEQLNKVRDHLDSHFLQIANIDLGVSPWNEGEGWQPIGEWSNGLSGSFDGNGYIIENLTIDYEGYESYKSLFQELAPGGIIENVQMKGVDVKGNSYVSALVAYQRGGEVRNCSVEGTIMANNNAGLLVAGSDGLITGSYSSGSVIALDINGQDYYFGGLVGRMSNPNAEIHNSYSTAEVFGDHTAGGLVGNAWGHSINNCYSIGKVTGYARTGGLVGHKSEDMEVNNSYWDIETSGIDSSAGGVGYVTSAMIKSTNSVPIYTDWDFENIWNIDEGNSYPYLKWQSSENIPYPPSPFAGGSGTEENPYEVATAEQLNEVRNYLDSHFIQIADIDLGVSPWKDGEGWNPIGSGSAPFEGSYDGDGYSIEGLYINRSIGRYQGLFGYVGSSAVLKNMDLSNSYVSADQYTGTLVGYNAGEISNCSSSNVEVLNGWDYAGGLVGFNSGTIYDSSTTGIVKTSDFNAGGLVGSNYGVIEDCFSEADLAPVDAASGGYPYQMGGLVGYNSGGTIEGSYAKGDVTGWKTIGGLVGENFEGSVINSNAEGNVSGNEEYIGGLVGINGYNSIIRDSYATGNANGVYYVGGLVGYNSSLVEGSHHRIGTVSGSERVGGLVGDNNGTIAESYAESNPSGTQYVGGLAGYSGYGEIRFTYASGDVSGSSQSVGGLVGSAQDTAINDSYAMGPVTGGSYIGGLAGYLSVGSSVTNCYSTGRVNGSSYVGGLIGSKTTGGTVPTVDDSYYNSETSYQSDNSGKGMPKTTAEMLSLSTYVGWDFPTEWTMNPTDNDGYPALYWQGFDHEGEFAGGSGTVSDPYQIATAEHLNNVRKYLDANFIQIEDIDLADYVTTGGDYYNDGKGWEPIGSTLNPFTGSYDGDNGNITNLSISGSDSRIGLFGTTSETSFIHDLNLIDVSIDGREFIGGIVGVSYGTIEACSVTGTIEGIMSVGGIAGWTRDGEIRLSSGSCTIANKTPTQGSRLGIIVGDNEAAIIESCTGSGIVQGIGSVGGIVGLNRGSGEIRDSFSDATVTGTTNYAGGLVGESQGTISNSYSTGNVSGGGYVGGLSGYNSGTIDKTFALGFVEGSDNFVGGLVGMNDASISNSYAYGNVIGDQYVGGLIGIHGYYNSSSALSNCYSTGVVNGTFRWGGLVGYKASASTVTSSYWDIDASGITSSAAGMGYTSLQMTDSSNFGGWDFVTVWDIDEGISYPYLR